MEQAVSEQMRAIIDEHIQVEDFRLLLHACIQDKAEEDGVWSAITILTHRVYGGSLPELKRLAACTELLLLGLDVLDDLQDMDNPGKPWMQAAPAVAMNAALALVMAAVGCIAGLEAKYAMRRDQADGYESVAARVSLLVTGAINGQHRDITNWVETEQDYVRMVYEKSGSLVRLACYLGYSFARKLPASEQERWSELGSLLGFMAQLDNDIRDIQHWDVKNDLIFKRRTLPVLFLLEQSYPPLIEYYEGSLTKEQFLKHKQACMEFIQESGCLEYSRAVLLLHLERAEQVLAELDADEEAKRAFADAAFAAFR